jgi:hypothetical protein
VLPGSISRKLRVRADPNKARTMAALLRLGPGSCNATTVFLRELVEIENSQSDTPSHCLIYRRDDKHDCADGSDDRSTTEH